MPVCDMHTHTKLSEDAMQTPHNDVFGYCNMTVKNGIKYIAFTDHRDICTVEGAINADLCVLEEQCNKAKQAFKGQLTIMFGAELAHMHKFPTEAQKILSRHSFDFVLGSIHHINGQLDPYFMDFSQYSDTQLKQLYDGYVDELCELAETCDFDSLAHITYPLRYFRKANREYIIDLTEYYPKYDKIFEALIRRKKALEINCSTFSEQAYAQPMPTYKLIERYISKGGRLFTLGSDSHYYKNVGFGIEAAQKFLLQHGIDKLCVFDKRQMYLINNTLE